MSDPPAGRMENSKLVEPDLSYACTAVTVECLPNNFSERVTGCVLYSGSSKSEVLGKAASTQDKLVRDFFVLIFAWYPCRR